MSQPAHGPRARPTGSRGPAAQALVRKGRLVVAKGGMGGGGALTSYSDSKTGNMCSWGSVLMKDACWGGRPRHLSGGSPRGNAARFLLEAGSI